MTDLTAQLMLKKCRTAFLRPVVSDKTLAIVLALLVGLTGGLGAVGFRYLISSVQNVAFGVGPRALSLLGHYWVIVIPALGGLIVGPIVYFFAREAKGHGVPEVMDAVARKGGRIRPRVILVKTLASAVSIGTGASVGREGPIVQIGSGLGSAIGQFFQAPERAIKVLVGCGAAAGIAATFNAPIAGVVFAQEIILSQFTAETFTLLVIASVSASVIASSFLGSNPAFIVTAYNLVHPSELIWYAALGLIAALAGRLFIELLYRLEDVFDAVRVLPEYSKPVVGGLLIGGMGFFYPQIFGVGYETMEGILQGNLAWKLLLILFIMKLIATSITIGSGHSGGVFAPSLFMGSALGGALGSLVHGFFPQVTATHGAYALVGMGAMVAATTQAPITAVLIIFELTRDYRIILALMIACGLSCWLSRAISRENIYTRKLLRRGVRLHAAMDLLQHVRVKEVMTPGLVAIDPEAEVGQVVQLMQDSYHTGFPVVDNQGILVGIITLNDIRELPLERRMHSRVKEVMSTEVVSTFPEESVADALHKLNVSRVGRLPVVQEGKPVGIITRSDLLDAYDRQVIKNDEG